MATLFKKEGHKDGEVGEAVVVIRDALNGDVGFSGPDQVFVRFGDGAEKAVDKDCLSEGSPDRPRGRARSTPAAGVRPTAKSLVAPAAKRSVDVTPPGGRTKAKGKK
jgi:hypothetical protein